MNSDSFGFLVVVVIFVGVMGMIYLAHPDMMSVFEFISLWVIPWMTIGVGIYAVIDTGKEKKH